jgi:hypothetical protein
MFDDDDKTVDKKKDKLILDYDTILKESALLTTFAGILFGFLLVYRKGSSYCCALFNYVRSINFYNACNLSSLRIPIWRP